MKQFILGLSLALFFILSFYVGFETGYHHWKKSSWDIWEDPRGCVIYWDDGSTSFKSRAIYLGDLAPGESKELKLEER